MLELGIAFAAGLFVGWVILPAPAFVTNFWAQFGWAKKTVP